MSPEAAGGGPPRGGWQRGLLRRSGGASEVTVPSPNREAPKSGATGVFALPGAGGVWGHGGTGEVVPDGEGREGEVETAWPSQRPVTPKANVYGALAKP